MSNYPFKLAELKYSYSALEPFISAKTLMLHHDKHMNAYVTNLNVALEKEETLQGLTLVELLSNEDLLKNNAIRNNGGGAFNHALYFDQFATKGSKVMSKEFESVLNKTFGSIEAFKKEFKSSAMGQFGSGWAWLVKDQDNLKIITTANQDTPLVQGLKPIMGIDVWEHAYYVDYLNLRGDYIDACFEIIDWEYVEANYHS